MLDIPVRVKDALRDGRLLKEYEILILDDEGAIEDTIDNNNLVYESVHINEKLCSGDVLKFGLCEGSSIEFEYFGKPDILGKRIHVLLHVQYKNDQDQLVWYHHISMGFFTVEKCPRQFSTGIYKATAYNKLMSNYLDAPAVDIIKNIQSDTGEVYFVTIYAILSELLEDYKIEPQPINEVNIAISSQSSRMDSFSFQLVGSSTRYSNPILTFDYYEFRPTYPGEARLILDAYISKLSREISNFKEWVFENVIDPSIFWSNFTRSLLYQDGCAVTCGFYSSGTVNCTYVIPEVSANNYQYAKHGNLNKVNSLNNVGVIRIAFPKSFGNNPTIESNPFYTFEERLNTNDVSVYQMPMSEADMIQLDIRTIPDVTLRELQSATYETVCQFGQLDRKTDLFAGIGLNKSALYPADTLYPAADLYPGGTRERTVKSGYSKLWSESGNVQSWRYLIITYKGLDSNNQEVEKTLTRTINANGTTDYNMSDNWLFKNLVWSDSDVEDYADAMALKMQDVTWFPFEMWGAGLPYLETGDQIEVVDNTGETYTSYVLSRQLDGIQNLQDTLMNGTLDIF